MFAARSPRLTRALALLAVLALAAFLRLWRLDQLPPGLYHDEAYNGLDALSLLEGETFPRFYEGWELYAQEAHADRPPQPTSRPAFFEGNFGREPLHVYLMALSIKLLGPTPQAIRLVPALAGVLAVFTTYLAAAALFAETAGAGLPEEANRRALPLLAGLALAVLFPAVHFSRFGIRAMLFLPVATLTVYFFWAGVNRAERRPSTSALSLLAYFLPAGFFLGLGIYTYAAARLFPLLFVLFVPLWFRLDRPAGRRLWPQLAAMAAAALMTALPLLLFLARYPYFAFFRIAYVANKGRGAVPGRPWLTWLQNVWRVVGGFFWQGETHLRHNLPGRPYLDPVLAVLFAAGLLSSLRRRLQPRSLFLGLWLLLMLLPSIFSGDAPHFGRLTGAAPAVAIFTALGVVHLADWLARRWQALSAGRALALGVLLLLVSGAWTTVDYFGRYASHPDLARDFYQADWQLGQYAAAQPAEASLYLSPTQEEMATIYFALADPERLASFSPSNSLIPLGVPGRPAVYLLRPDQAATLARLSDAFPLGQQQSPAPAFVAFHIPADAERLPSFESAEADFAGEITLLGYTLIQGGDRLSVSLAWSSLARPGLDYTAFVHLLDENGAVAAQSDRPPDGYPTGDWGPGEIVLDTFVVELPPDLPPGAYTLQTGFYDLASLVRLGQPARLTTLDLP